MNDNVISERKQQKINLNFIREFFDDEVDDTIKEYIFDSTDFEECVEDTERYVFYFNNIMSLAFIFAHGCYKYDCTQNPQSCKERAKNHNSLRIINSLEKAFVQYPATSELIQFVLTDIQFDMIQGSNNSELLGVFENMCNFNSQEFSLVKYFKIISQWKASPSRYTPSTYGMKDSDISGMMCELLENMSFLSDYNLVCNGTDNFVFEPKRKLRKLKTIPVPHLLFKDEEKYFGIFTLFSAEKSMENNTQALNLRYLSCDSSSTLSFTVSNNQNLQCENFIDADPEEVYSEITGGDSWNPDSDEEEGKKNGNFIDQIHTINYKYIKNLALAVSDAISINPGSKEVLVRSFYRNHRDIFDKIDKDTDLNKTELDWDGIIVMLLIEASPTRVLEALIKGVRRNFYDISKNVCKRIDNPSMPIYGLNNSELDNLVYEVIESKSITGEAYAFGKLPVNKSSDKLYPSAAANLIISSLSVLEEDPTKKMICAGNISDNKSLLEKMQREGSTETKIKYVSVILGETFKHLLCFYKGVIEYGKIKTKFDAESSDKCLTEAQIASYQKQLNAHFMDAAKQEAVFLKDFDTSDSKDVIRLIDLFVDFCEKNKSSNALFVTLGKHEILNINDFKNCAFHYIGNLIPMTSDNIEDWMNFTLNILEYLKTGSFNDTPVDSALFNAVYPFSATYNRGNENYDGYRTATFTLNIDIDGDNKAEYKGDINVLTEFSYNLSSVFYCLPNILRSNKKWWIDPLLIDFKEFNDIFID